LGGSGVVELFCANCNRTMRVPLYETKNGVHWMNQAPGAGAIRQPLLSTAPDHPLPQQDSAVGNDVGRMEAVAFITSTPNPSYACYQQFMKASMKEAMGDDHYRSIMAELNDMTTAVLQNQFKVAIDAIKSGRYANCVVISCDGTYLTRGHSSPYTTVDAICKNNHCLVSVVHLAKSTKEKRGLMVHWPGTAKASEAFGVEVLFKDLRARDVPVHFVVIDGDSSCQNAVAMIYAGATIIICTNHRIKAVIKALIADFSKRRLPAAKITDSNKHKSVCTCEGHSHSWATNPCGCAHLAHAKALQSMFHACACAAGTSPAVFRDRLSELPAHMQGNHSACTFHAKNKCSGRCEPKCPTRKCDCHDCEEGKRECWGTPLEPQCDDGGCAWSSKLASVTCPFHLGLIENAVEQMKKDADAMIISGAGLGKLDSNENEKTHAVMHLSCMKGLHVGDDFYAATANIGLLKSNQVHFANLQLQLTNTTELQPEWCWRVELYRRMGIGISAATQAQWLSDLNARRKVSAFMKTAVSKFRRMKAKQKTIWAEAQRKQWDGGRTYGRDAVQAIAASCGSTYATGKVHYDSGTLVFVDIETAGYGVYDDTVMELACVVVAYSDDASGKVAFRDLGEFRELSYTGAVNSKAKGHDHLSIGELRGAQSECDLMHNWIAFLHRTCPVGQQAYIVAHNGKVFDLPHLCRALNRAELDPVGTLREVGVVGVVDTLLVSKHIVRWALITTALGTAGFVAHSENSVFVETLHQIPVQRRAQTATVTAVELTDDDVGDFDTICIEEPCDSDVRHSQGMIYEQLFNEKLTDAHSALVDTKALVRIVKDMRFWECIRGIQVAIHLSWMVEYSVTLYGDHLHQVRGWRLEHYEQCDHGPMLPRVIQCASFEDGFKVVFHCRSEDGQKCREITRGTHADYIPPPPKWSRNGEAGACNCKATCQRDCPCKAKGMFCGDGCKHNSKSNKCVNFDGYIPPSRKPRSKSAPPQSANV
jgi:uncharacterized protein YprB with RNaseH-like and TPR domain